MPEAKGYLIRQRRGFAALIHFGGKTVRKYNAEIIQARVALFVKGVIVRKLDANGEPLMRDGEQVWTLAKTATPDKLARWRTEHVN
jgi:hypothetical protein